MGDLTIAPLTAETWPAFDALVAGHNGIFSGCWCTWFTPECAEKHQSAEGNRALKKRLVEEGRNHAALVLDGDTAIGWAEFGPPDELPNIHHRKQYLAETEVLPDYRITCIFVTTKRRRAGVAEAALHGALDLIARAGGGTVEGYPHDTGGKQKTASFLYNGTRTMYERAGFTYVRPKGQGNCVMSRVVLRA